MRQGKPTVSILTQGCKVNQYESEAIAEAFERAGFTVCDSEAVSDIYVVNTCTVTGESDRKAGQLIRRAAARNPAAFVIVTGCFAQSRPEAAAAIPGVDFVCGNRRKLAVVEAARRLLANGKNSKPEISVGDLTAADFEPMCITHFDRTRAYVKIEDGCENHCTYCAIRGARGRVRSKPPREILSEIEALSRGGCREIVLTGIETASFGKDLDNFGLADLLEMADRVPGIGRIRLGSLEPTLMSEAFVTRIAALSHLAPHFHLSVQSGSSAVLAAMKRKYNAEQAMSGIRRLRALLPGTELTADLIVGFPGETEADFQQTVAFVKEADFLQIHVFAYSRRAGTPAAVMPGQIPVAVKKARSAELIRVGRECRLNRLHRALQTPIREVLFESYEDGLAIGHTAEFLETAVPSPVPLHSQLHTVRLLSADENRLLAELVR